MKNKKLKLKIGNIKSYMIILAIILAVSLPSVMAITTTSEVSSEKSNMLFGMNSIHLSLTMIILGGILGVLFSNWFRFSKILAISFITRGLNLSDDGINYSGLLPKIA